MVRRFELKRATIHTSPSVVTSPRAMLLSDTLTHSLPKIAPRSVHSDVVRQRRAVDVAAHLCVDSASGSCVVHLGGLTSLPASPSDFLHGSSAEQLWAAQNRTVKSRMLAAFMVCPARMSTSPMDVGEPYLPNTDIKDPSRIRPNKCFYALHLDFRSSAVEDLS